MSLEQLKITAINIANTGSPKEKNDACMILTEALKNYGDGAVLSDPDISRHNVNSVIGSSTIVTNNRNRSPYVSGNGSGTARLKQLAAHTQFVTSQDNILPDIMYVYSQIFVLLDPLSGLESDQYSDFYIDRANLIAIGDSVNPDYEGATANAGFVYVSPFLVDYDAILYNAPHGNLNLD